MAEKPENADSGSIAKLLENLGYRLKIIYMIQLFLYQFCLLPFSVLVWQFCVFHIIFLSFSLAFRPNGNTFRPFGWECLRGIDGCPFVYYTAIIMIKQVLNH